MKRFLRIFVPLLLTLALVISLGWYFLKYDTEFTQDILISQARAMDDRGNHSLATWLYQLAYRQSGNDESIALELAQQYHDMGNYTKAEYTLSNAIADGGSMELYIALCNIYVEQNKLLDAVTMLDNVSNPVIKKQLDALRPDIITPSHEPGYYNQYISLSFSSSKGSIYVTTDGTYPTSKSEAYNQPISINAGETVVTALCVGENGLVSPLCVFRYTVTGVIEEVTISDPAMDQAIRSQLSVSEDHTLYSNELWGITELEIPKDSKSLSDLSKLPFLTRLTMNEVSVDQLTDLSSLTALEELIIHNTSISSEDLTVIASLPKLQTLTMVKCGLSTIAPLSEAKNLTHLDLSNNSIRDLTALESLTNLVELKLSHNAVTELSSLSGLVRLEILDASYNLITTTAPLGGCIRLRDLQLSNNELSDLHGLNSLTGLQALDVSYTGLTDVSALAANIGLTNLNISNNALWDITALNTLNKLEVLDFSHNQVTQLPEFDKDCTLYMLIGSHNQLTSMEEIEGLICLNYALLDYNYGLTSIEPALNCYGLIELDVRFTGITNVSDYQDELKKIGLIVHHISISTEQPPSEDGSFDGGEDDFDPLA